MNKEYAEIITRCIFDEVHQRFVKLVKHKTTKGIREIVYVMKLIKTHLENRSFTPEENQFIAECKVDFIKKISKEERDYFKANINDFVKQFSDTKDSLTVITDAVDAVLFIQLCSDVREVCYACVFKSKMIDFKMADYNKKNIHNINIYRNSDTPEKCYPENDRPRGYEDVVSVRHHMKTLQEGHELEPIWILQINGKKYILDGFHRIAATSVEKRASIKAYYVKM
jgi:hypothetical protein